MTIHAALAEWARTLPPEAIAVLGAIAAFLAVLAIGVQVSVRAMRAELDHAEEELVDRDTGLLPRSALRVRLGAELAWAGTSRTPLALAVLRIRGSRFTHGARVLRHAMREEESAFLLGDQHVAVELWGADEEAAVAATRRIGEDLARAGHPVVDAGLACSPADGSDVDTLVGVARRDLRPVDDPGPRDEPRRHERSRVRHTLTRLAVLAPPFAALGLLLLVAWRLLPAAIEPLLDDGERDARELVVAMVSMLGLPLGAALLHASCWNVGDRLLPRSRPVRQASAVAAFTIALVIAVPLAWGVHAPRTAPTEAFGASLAVLALVVLALMHARRFVHLDQAALALLLGVGAATTWFAVEQAELPVVANAGRMLAAAALGALLARQVERASWMLFLAGLAAAVDIWSVYADAGVTRQLLDPGAGGRADRLVELLLFTGPSVDGAPLFAIGVTDLVFLALFLAWSHDWRLDMRIVGAAMVAAAWAATAVGVVVGEIVPMLPFLAAAMVLVLVTRSVHLRARVSAWRHVVGSAEAG